MTYEAGPTGFGLARFLVGHGIDCQVAAPSKLQRPSGDRVKTDVRDARHLARLLHLGEIVAVTVPSVEQEAARDLVRAREDVRGDLMAARHRLSKLLLRQGIVYYGGKAWTGNARSVAARPARQAVFDQPGLGLAFDIAYDTVLATLARRDRLDAAIAQMAASSEFTPVVTRLGCLRGVSTLTAFGLAVEIGDWQRLTGRTIGAYLGLVPTESSSGRSRSQGSITKTGNGHARRLLIEAAWHHRRPDRPSVTLRRRQDLASPAARDRGLNRPGSDGGSGYLIPTSDLVGPVGQRRTPARTRRVGCRRGSRGGAGCCASGPSRGSRARRPRRSSRVRWRAGPRIELGLVVAVDGLGQGVVVAVADGPDRGDGADLGEPFAVADGGELRPGIAVTPQPVAAGCRVTSGPSRSRRGPSSVRMCDGDPPADDHPRERVDDEAHVGDPGPGRHEGQVGDPQLVRGGRGELPLRPGPGAAPATGSGRVVRTRLVRRAPSMPAGAHQPGDLVAADVEPGPAGGLPQLAGPVDAVVVLPQRHQLRGQRRRR